MNVLKFLLTMLHFLILILCATQVFCQSDEITSLPGLKDVIHFKQYSGYLNATDGRFLHYWFVESQRSPATDPLILWMNGGPGCSSVDGFLTELGPFHVNADGNTLYNNPYSWNKVANVIFLEAPAGVGFSYALNKNYSTDDDAVSKDNYLALQNFFVKFPQFKKNDFYITGESYAGIYIPTLSVRVLTGPANINFKGFAIGNGLLDSPTLLNSIVFFAYYHGLIGPALWSKLTLNCCEGPPSESTCSFAYPPTLMCNHIVLEASNIVRNSGLNMYNLYADCAPSSARNSRYLVDKRNLLKLFPQKNSQYNNLHEELACLDSTNETKYLNLKSVRKALHIPDFVPNWEVCSSEVDQGYKNTYITMQPQILQLVNSGRLRGLIYNGDVDMACNYLGNEWFTRNLNLPVIKNYDKWMYNDQIAGFVKYYNNLTLLTVKGSGHMVPQDKPGPALKMITSFLSNTPY